MVQATRSHYLPTLVLSGIQVGDLFPYTIPGTISLTSSTLSGFYYNFYNWVVTTGCESPRVQITPVYTTPPAITASAFQTAICVNKAVQLV